MRDGMTIVKTFINDAEARLALGHLQAMGIEGMITADNCGGMRPHMDLTGGVDLLVPDADREQALAFLDGSAQELVSVPWTCRSCGEEIEAGFDACWQCGGPMS